MKHVIMFAGCVIGMKYNEDSGECTIGGNKRFSGNINDIIHTYFVKPEENTVVDCITTTKNKCKFVFNVGGKRYREAMNGMIDGGFAMDDVRTLDRIFR